MISQGVALLSNLDQQRQAKRTRYSIERTDEPDQDADSTAPIFDAFLDSQGAEGTVLLNRVLLISIS